MPCAEGGEAMDALIPGTCTGYCSIYGTLAVESVSHPTPPPKNHIDVVNTVHICLPLLKKPAGGGGGRALFV